ncbi:MAG: carbohydrate ABC transporter permease [Proteobacteria bacterium]|nr:carbohydrate ABC transporter permease [Pseudomonadota bacterium]
MSVARPPVRPVRRLRRRLRWIAVEASSALLALLLMIWSLLPVYNMLLIALDDEGDIEYAGVIWPNEATLESFRMVWTEGYWYLEHFWHQFANSLYIGLATMVLTVVIGSLASFAVSRTRLRKGWLLTNIALLTYVIPASLMVIPFHRVAHAYGLTDNLLTVVAAEVAFATPFAILTLQQYARLIPFELDEAARVDGASLAQVYLRIYLPLMAPALAAVGTYALLLAWGEYLYQWLLLSSPRNMTVAVAIEQFFDSDEAPWNYMMAAAIVYALPPVAIFYGLRRYMAAGLTAGGVRG